jgi:ADP-heptose:LPS heptosyltransferase
LQVISLQKELRTEDLASLTEHPNANFQFWGEDLKDFADTAALCACMDLVISVDTSVAHLAAALGIPCWILLPNNPDWRWLLEGDSSDWYACVRLYRQDAAGHLGSTLSRLQTDLLQRFRKQVESPPCATLSDRGKAESDFSTRQ